jgi:predicted TPR repeat methyltransferase
MRKEIHDRVLTAKTTEELMDAYRQWADHYDEDLLEEMGYVAPMIAVQLLSDYLPKSPQRILDAGCGTGIVGSLLKERGCETIDGLDYSESMLRQAKSKAVYTRLLREDLNTAIGIGDEQYDAVISVGTFTSGHVGPHAFLELIRVSRPGGLLCFTVRQSAWEEQNYAKVLAEFTTRGLWRLEQQFEADYIRQEGATCIVCLYRKAHDPKHI